MLGYALSSEEHGPRDLVRFARRAEDVGFSFALISDHFHPWIDRQGQSPFVWSVIGGIAMTTQHVRLGTGVTCPLVRIHPAIVAQAAATCGAMMPGRFFLGLGTGENLNEHVVGQGWPPAEIRLEMMEEAIEVIRLLWQGGEQSHYGPYFTVENACIYTLPEELPPVYLAASHRKAAELAGRACDGFISTAPKKALVDAFDAAGGAGKRKIGQVAVCWAEDENEAKATAHELWPIAGLSGDFQNELPTPRHLEQAAQLVKPDDVAKTVPLGPDPARHVEAIEKFYDAGYDDVYVHQIGSDQEGFFRFYEREVLPHFARRERRENREDGPGNGRTHAV